MQGLKILVGVMTALIFVCLGLVIYGISSKAARMGAGQADATLTLPPQTSIRQITGYPGGLALYVTGAGGERILLADPSTGKISATLKIERAKHQPTPSAQP